MGPPASGCMNSAAIRNNWRQWSFNTEPAAAMKVDSSCLIEKKKYNWPKVGQKTSVCEYISEEHKGIVGLNMV